MSTLTLFPPLSVIQERLFGLPDDELLALAENRSTLPDATRQAALNDPHIREKVMDLRAQLAQDDTPDPIENTGAKPPDFIQKLMAQKVATRSALSGSALAPGLMIQITQLLSASGQPLDVILGAPFTVLLDRQSHLDHGWHGWVVSPDTDYAGFWDFVLQDEDRPFDPVCGMVQLWNPIQLYLPSDFKGEVLGKLSPERLQSLRALAVEFVEGCESQPKPNPGRVALRSTYQGYSVVTGTPLDERYDPRLAYQADYHHAAQILNAPLLAKIYERNVFQELIESIRNAWQQVTGDWIESQPPVAYAMGDIPKKSVSFSESPSVAGIPLDQENQHQVLMLRDDLSLDILEQDDAFKLTLRYKGSEPLTVRWLEDDKLLESTTLSAEDPTTDFWLDDSFSGYRLQLQQGDTTLDLPLWSEDA